MVIELVRYGSIPTKSTPGELLVSGVKLFTVEREWLDNQKNTSCIPTGTYKLVPHSSTRHGETWAVVNEALGIYHYDDEDNSLIKRWGILFHVANWAKELEGCIGVGRYIGSDWGVSSSRHGMEYLLALLSDESEHTLTISYKRY